MKEVWIVMHFRGNISQVLDTEEAAKVWKDAQVIPSEYYIEHYYVGSLTEPPGDKK